jgi:hypothetical protein
MGTPSEEHRKNTRKAQEGKRKAQEKHRKGMRNA